MVSIRHQSILSKNSKKNSYKKVPPATLASPGSLLSTVSCLDHVDIVRRETVEQIGAATARPRETIDPRVSSLVGLEPGFSAVATMDDYQNVGSAPAVGAFVEIVVGSGSQFDRHASADTTRLPRPLPPALNSVSGQCMVAMSL